MTNHSLGVWDNSARSANQIFFKVHSVEGGFIGIVAHLPHAIPKPLKNELLKLLKRDPSLKEDALRKRELGVWEKVHKVLDQKLVRLP